MTTPSTTVVDQMFAAFAAQDLETAVATVSDDSVWVHHGSQKLPAMRFEGKEGVRQFFQTSFTSMAVEYFDVLETVASGDKVIVFGREKFTMEGVPGDLAQQWVQVYTVVDGKITRMDEYATSAEESDYQVVR